MLSFDIITIFPEIFNSFLKGSLIARAQKKKLIRIRLHNLRDFAFDKHKTVDDKPFGGGRGMILKLEPIYKAVISIRNPKLESKNSKVILFSPRGERFNQKKAIEFSKLNQLILICGRYEGVDERVAKYLTDINLSIGDYILMGGEVAGMVLIEAVSRLIPGVVGKSSELLEKGFIEFPQYTRPEIFETKEGKKWRVPKVLISGHHKKIEEWRQKHKKMIGGGKIDKIV